MISEKLSDWLLEHALFLPPGAGRKVKGQPTIEARIASVRADAKRDGVDEVEACVRSGLVVRKPEAA